MRAIKLFARQSERTSAWQTMLVAETNASLWIQKLQIFYRVVNASLTGVICIALLWMSTQQILVGTLNTGMLMAFLAYRSQFLRRKRQPPPVPTRRRKSEYRGCLQSRFADA